MATLQYSKTLKQIARDVQKALVRYAPRDTGDLHSALLRTNTLNSILGKTRGELNYKKKTFDINIQVDVAPSDADYGVWFNNPPKVKSKRRQALERTARRKGNWQFGDLAIAEGVDTNLNELAESIAEDLANQIEEYLSNI